MLQQGALGQRAAGAGRPFSGRPSAAPRRQALQKLTVRFDRNKPGPPDAPKERQQGREWIEGILARFGPASARASNVTTLDFEKPLVELDNRIKEVRACDAGEGAAKARASLIESVTPLCSLRARAAHAHHRTPPTMDRCARSPRRTAWT